jgi:cell wall-associated NlpC family hydrolase
LCVAATPGSLLPRCAEASHTVVIKRGDSIDSLARKHRVSIGDIAKANGISPDAVLIDGKRLVIPDPPKSVVKVPTMRRTARVTGDRITVRLGPYEGYRRLTLLDHGANVVVTRKAGDWFQVQLQSGRTGWVKRDFLTVGRELQVAARPAPKRVVNAARPRKERTKHVASASKRAKKVASATKPSKRRVAAVHKAQLRRPARVAKATHKRRAPVRVADGRRHTRSRSKRPEASAPKTRNDVIQTAYAYRGTPYRFGGTGRKGFDCSGFTGYIYAKKGVRLPRTAREQFSRGQRVSSKELKEGDLVFFHTTHPGISHVGIYAGNGKFVHASSSGGSVRVDSLSSGYYKQRLVGARRVK